MLSLILSVTTGGEFRAARRRLFYIVGYILIPLLFIPLLFLTVSLSQTALVLGLYAAVYLVGVVVPLLSAPLPARQLTKYLRSRVDASTMGVFYLLAPAREWLRRNNVDLFRLDQYGAVLIAGRNLQLWGSGRRPRLLYEIELRQGMKATWGEFDGFPCLLLHLDKADPLPLLQWKELLGVVQEWPAGWADRIELAATRDGGVR